MIVDYFLIRHGNLYMPDIFTLSSKARYHYFHGVNFRAFVAFIIGFLLPLPGFAASFGHTIGAAATHMYSLGWVLSFLMGSLAYYLICLVWSVPGDDGKHGWEEQVHLAQETILDGEGSFADVEVDTPEDYSYKEKGAQVRSEPAP